MSQRPQKRLKPCDVSKSLAISADSESSGSLPPKAQLVYRPVQQGQTRLLRLHRSTEYEAELEGDLAKVDLIDREGATLIDEQRPVTYECLSYSWGQSALTGSILLNGQMLAISSTLAGFLRQYRERNAVASKYGPKCEWLWVDQICINQRDPDEKSMQVKNMITIYSTASSVIAWLGEAIEATQYAAYTLRYDGLPSPTPDHPKMDVTVFNGLKNLYSRPWLRRIWIRQEVWAAKSLSIWCGSSTVNAYMFFERPIKLRSIQFRDKECEELPENLKTLKQLASDERRRPTKSIFAFLVEFTGCAASDPRDRIYALLGMSLERDLLEVDYSKSTGEVFADLAHLWFELDNSERTRVTEGMSSRTEALKILPKERVPSGSGISDLPSWVPDWRLGGNHWRFSDDHGRLSGDYWITPIPSCRNGWDIEDLNEQVSRHTVGDWRVLELYGWTLGVVLSNYPLRFSRGPTAADDEGHLIDSLQDQLQGWESDRVFAIGDLLCFFGLDQLVESCYVGDTWQPTDNSITVVVLRPEKQETGTGTGTFRYVTKFALRSPGFTMDMAFQRKFPIW